LTRPGYSEATAAPGNVPYAQRDFSTTDANLEYNEGAAPTVALTDDITDPRLAKALAHPLRLEILRHLGDRTASPSEIAAEIDAPLTNVSYHVRKLRALGLIKLVRKTPKRGVVEHYYSAKPRIQVSDEAWGQTPTIVKRALSAPWAKAGADALVAAAHNGGFDRGDSHYVRTDRQLDERGWTESTKVLHEALAKLDAVEQEARKRLAADPSVEPVLAVSLTALFEVPERAPLTPRPAKPATRRRRSAAASKS
jgi:DNA-binding transcriptional ArsR family regulator